MILLGVLGFQGDIEEHEAHAKLLDVPTVRVKSKEDLDKVSHLVLPGGESTTIGKWLVSTGVGEAIQARVKDRSLQVYGTCAGAILLASEVESKVVVHKLGLIDMHISRNAYGSQVHSFGVMVDAPALNTSFEAIFIRAPKILSVGRGVNILAEHEGNIIVAEQENVLVSTFHPELTTDTTIYKYFLGK